MSCEKGVAFSSLGEKSCEIKSGGQEITAMILQSLLTLASL